MAQTLLLGTTKGTFLLRSDDARDGWTVEGPFCDGWPINHVVSDPDTGALWAGGGGAWHGAGIWRSDDGASWTLTKLTTGELDDWAAQDPDVAASIDWDPTPPPFGDAFPQIWSLNFAHGVLHAGTKGANLLRSTDRGVTFHRVDSLSDHPSRDSWVPGGAGLVLHTLVSHPKDPAKMWTAASVAGVFATEDGGKTWDRRNRMSNAEAPCHHDHPETGEVGHCVHNMVRAGAATDGDVLYQQNHHGVWRSSDGGRSWDDAGHGLPSTFGFPISVHPRDPHTIWTLPLNGDSQGRYPPDAAAAVWKSTNGGQSWRPVRAGLPQTACFFTVLRQAMAVDGADPVGLYFGTNSGSVFASTDEGESWTEIARHLPTILSVEVAATP